MVLIVKDFDGYGFKYSSIITSKPWASIQCYSGMNWVGTIQFLDEDPLPKNSYSNNRIKMHLHISYFNDIIGLLRYEKPIQLCFDDTKFEAWIEPKPSVTREPVGEQEGV